MTTNSLKRRPARPLVSSPLWFKHGGVVSIQRLFKTLFFSSVKIGKILCKPKGLWKSLKTMSDSALVNSQILILRHILKKLRAKQIILKPYESPLHRLCLELTVFLTLLFRGKHSKLASIEVPITLAIHKHLHSKFTHKLVIFTITSTTYLDQLFFCLLPSLLVTISPVHFINSFIVPL